jgi:CMP/dCMP kinase
MQNNNKISISGDLGSGKTTVSFLLADQLHFKRYATGDIQRKLAAEKNMTTLEFNKLSETKDYIDKLIDGTTAEMAKSEESIVFDSRMAWYFVPNSFSVRLIINDVVGAERIMNAQRGSIEEYKDIEDALQKVKERKSSEKNRFALKYGVNLLDFLNYDLIIDTSYVTAEEVTNLIIEKYNLWKKDLPYHKVWINPKNLYPSQKLRNINMEKLNQIKDKMNETGFNENNPIEMIRFDENNYIFNGHHRVGAALLNEVKFVPVNLIAKENPLLSIGETLETFVKNSCELTLIYDWEDVFNFRFKSYPEFLKK